MKNKRYKAILFDLDNTLCDDKENRKYAFQKVLKYQGEEVSDLKLNKFIEIDEKFWKERAAGKIKDPYEFKSKEEKATWCRAQRFLIYYNNEISFEKAVELNEMYMEHLKERVVPINGAYEIIKYIYDNKYDIYIVTNGVKGAVPFKLEKLGINNYIKDVITAEEVGYMKPHKEFFEEVKKRVSYNKEEMLLIGDELEKDIKGGNDNDIDTCWLNQNNAKYIEYIPTYEIKKLLELKNIL